MTTHQPTLKTFADLKHALDRPQEPADGPSRPLATPTAPRPNRNRVPPYARRVTKSEWYKAGALANTRCWRRQNSAGIWEYYINND